MSTEHSIICGIHYIYTYLYIWIQWTERTKRLKENSTPELAHCLAGRGKIKTNNDFVCRRSEAYEKEKKKHFVREKVSNNSIYRLFRTIKEQRSTTKNSATRISDSVWVVVCVCVCVCIHSSSKNKKNKKILYDG